MTTRADFEGPSILGAYQEGVDKNTARNTLAVDSADRHAINAGNARGLDLRNDDTAYTSARTKSINAGIDAIPVATANPAAAYASATGLDTGNTPLPAATPAPPSAFQQEAAAKRITALAKIRAGDYTAGHTLNAEARTADANHISAEGAKLADDPAAWTAMTDKLSAGHKSLSMGVDPKTGRDKLSITQPNGKTTFHDMDYKDKVQFASGVALMQAGFVDEGLGKFNTVDAHLAAEVAYSAGLVQKVADQRNKVDHEKQDDDAKTTAANAAMVHAKAAADRAAQERTKQMFGPPIKTVDDKGNASYSQPMLVNGKYSLEAIALPAGSHFPNEKPALTLTKTGDGILATDHSGDPMYVTGTDGVPRPAEADPFGGKMGLDKAATWKADGVEQRIWHLPNGKLVYAYENTANPDDGSGSGLWKTPQEAKANGAAKKAANQTITGPKWPVAGAGRGLSATTPAPDAQAGAYDAAVTAADADRSASALARELKRAKDKTAGSNSLGFGLKE